MLGNVNSRQLISLRRHSLFIRRQRQEIGKDIIIRTGTTTITFCGSCINVCVTRPGWHRVRKNKQSRRRRGRWSYSREEPFPKFASPSDGKCYVVHNVCCKYDFSLHIGHDANICTYIYNGIIFPSLSPAKIFQFNSRWTESIKKFDGRAESLAQWLIHQMKLSVRYCENFEFITFLREF